MNTAYFHLVLNHIPVVGLLFSFVLLLLSFLRKSEELRKAAFLFFVIAACFVVPTYLTGEGAEETVEHLAGVSEQLIENHEEIAEAALVTTLLTGIVALVGLFLSAYARHAAIALIFFALFNVGLLGYTAKLGGEIRHTEVRNDFVSAVSGHAGMFERHGEFDDDD